MKAQAVIHRPGRKRHWASPATKRRLGRAGLGIFLALVAWLVVDRAIKVDWGAVGEAIAAYPVGILVLAMGLALLSHLLYACYDLVGRRYTKHTLNVPTVLGVGLVSYAFNLNLGSLVGGFGFRWRLYTRLGLRTAQAARLIGLSLVTNWSGFLLLAGIVLATRAVELPQPLHVGMGVLQGAGAVMIALPLGYVAWCACATRRNLHLRGHHFHLPGGRMAAVQLLLSSANWALIGSIVWLLLPEKVAYGTVLATLLMAGIAGVITHVPGGLGVIEAVFVAVLGGTVDEGPLIAALLVYRAVYYLLPLAGATAMYLGFEAHARRRAAAGLRPPPA